MVLPPNNNNDIGSGYGYGYDNNNNNSGVNSYGQSSYYNQGGW